MVSSRVRYVAKTITLRFDQEIQGKAMSKSAGSPEIPSLSVHPALAPIASQLFYFAVTETEPARFLRHALPLLGQAVQSEYVALIQAARGRWRTVASTGADR